MSDSESDSDSHNQTQTPYSSLESSLLDDQDLTNSSFADLDFDSRLLQALALIKLSTPTPIQAKAIPLALGLKKDIIGQAKTGSGKTVAYAIPIVESILRENKPGNRAIILVPSRELADQVTNLFKSLALFAHNIVSVLNVSQHLSNAGNALASVMVSLLAAKPAIIVGTPARVLHHIQSGSIDPQNIAYLVIDEADLILSYGFRSDLDALADLLPVKKTIQTWLMSATIGPDVEPLKLAFCRKNLAVLRLQDSIDSDSPNKLLQYYVKTSEPDKFLLAYVIFKLKLVRGKTLIFVNSTERCYQLKLFLEQFGIRATVLNAELPLASRLHIVQEYNQNVYDLLIATDTEQENDTHADAEFSASRGVDFRNVACVLNFDLPASATAYTHRVGRTARADRAGMALSFVVPRKDWRKDRHTSVDSAKKDERVLARIMKRQDKRRKKQLRRAGVPDWATSTAHDSDAATLIQPYLFDMAQLESFRYRMEGALKAVTKMAVREARLKELRHELLASERLKRHFEENPADLEFLRHDRELHAAAVQPHLKRVPAYLLPATGVAPLNKQVAPVGARKTNTNRVRKHRRKEKRDPLKTFKK